MARSRGSAKRRAKMNLELRTDNLEPGTENYELRTENCELRTAFRRKTHVGVGIEVTNLNAWYGANHTLQDINLNIPANHATALIGPSGCGKSTFVRCLNRMHETNTIARVTGLVRIGDLDIYSEAKPVEIRRRVGMVFQRPNPFPTMSIYDNVAAGLKLNGYSNRKQLDEVVEKSLNNAALWDEVKDSLHKQSGAGL